MVEFYVPYLILSILALLFSKLIPLLHQSKTSSTKLPCPPGNTGWPIIGETWSYMSMAKKGLQHRFISDRIIQHSAPNIFKTSLLGETMAVMATPEGNKFLFSNENNLVQSWWPKSTIDIFNGHDKPATASESKKLRKLLVPPFLKPDSLQRYVSSIDELTKQHLQHQEEEEEEGVVVIKIHALAKHHMSAISSKLFLSTKDREVEAKIEDLLARIEAGIVALPVDLPGTKYRRAKAAAREFHEMVLVMIKQRKMMIGNSMEDQDLLSYLLDHHSEEDGEFDKNYDIAKQVLSFIFPSYHETSIVIASVVNCLADHPQVYDRVQREQMEIANSKGTEELLNWKDIQKMTYSWNVAKEVLRLFPAGLGGFREAITDFSYQGFMIPKGWKIHWSVYATHKNPKYFVDPEKFDPSRFEGNDPVPYTFVPFGGGPRMCPGKGLARLQILVFMHNLVTKYKYEKVFADEKLVYDPILAPTKGLPIRLYPISQQTFT